MSIKAIIFDLDDTLISEKQYIYSGFKHVSKILSKKYNVKEDELYEVLCQLFNISSKNVFNRVLEVFNIKYTQETITFLVNEYRNHSPTIKYYNDVLPCIKMLKGKKIKTGIITDGYLYAQQQKIKAIGADKHFDEIIITDQLGKRYWKPHPKPFELMKESLDVNFEELIYIGDNPNKDFYISEIYPVKTVRIIRDNNIYEKSDYLNGVKENYTISSLREIFQLALI